MLLIVFISWLFGSFLVISIVCVHFLWIAPFSLMMTLLCDDVKIHLHMKAHSWNNLQEVRRIQSKQIFGGKRQFTMKMNAYTIFYSDNCIIFCSTTQLWLNFLIFNDMLIVTKIHYNLLDPSPSPTPPPPPTLCNQRPFHVTCLEFTWKRGGVVVGRGWGESKRPSSFSSTLPQSAVRQQ